jgi:hypothetical protein
VAVPGVGRFGCVLSLYMGKCISGRQASPRRRASNNQIVVLASSVVLRSLQIRLKAGFTQPAIAFLALSASATGTLPLVSVLLTGELFNTTTLFYSGRGLSSVP